MTRQATELRRLLDTMRGLSIGLLGTQQFAANARDLVLLAALGTGSMTPHKLAMYCGVPRPTAVRRLARLEAKGLVQRRPSGTYTLTPDGLRRPGAGTPTPMRS